MRKLMMTTALVTATSFAVVTGAGAQMAETSVQNGTAAVAAHEMVPAFLSSDFTGMTLYAVDTEASRELLATHDGATDQRWIGTEGLAADRDAWENVGSVGDIVMTRDGEIRGILVDVGGFLGFGARTVMIDMEDLFFVADAEAPEGVSDYLVVAAMSRDQLEALPEWSDDMLHTGFAPRAAMAPEHDATIDNAAPLEQADMTGGTGPAGGVAAPAPEGYMVVDATVPTAEQILSATVHDAEGQQVGGVDDLILAADGGVSEMIVDVGGFLGIGSHTVSIPANNAEILWNAEDDSLRIHLPMTRDQLESLPEVQG